MATEKEFQPMISERLWAMAVGETVLKVAKNQSWLEQVESKAIRLLGELQLVLDDRSLDDATCLQRMDQVLEKWHGAGLDTARHAELD